MIAWRPECGAPSFRGEVNPGKRQHRQVVDSCFRPKKSLSLSRRRRTISRIGTEGMEMVDFGKLLSPEQRERIAAVQQEVERPYGLSRSEEQPSELQTLQRIS